MKHTRIRINFVLALFSFLFTGCANPVDLKDFNGNIITVKGKEYVLKGKVMKDHDLLINGSNVQLNPDKTFEKKLSLEIGDNKYRLEVAPKRRDKDSAFQDIIIKREMFPAEAEYAKAAAHKVIYKGRSDDIAIDRDYKQLVTVCGHGSPRIYDLYSGRLVKELPKMKEDLGFDQAVTFTPDNKHILVGMYWSNICCIIDTNNYSYLKSIRCGGGGGRFAISYPANAIITSSNGIFRIDPNNFNIMGNYHNYGSVAAISFDPTGKYIASSIGGYGGLIKITDTDKFRTSFNDQGYRDYELKNAIKSKIANYDIKRIIWNSSGDGIIGGSDRGELVVCRFNKDKSFDVIKSVTVGSSIYSLALNQDNTILITSTKTHVIVLDYPSLKNKITFETHGNKVIFSLDNDIFYYANNIGVFEATLKNINWQLIDEYYRLKRDKVI